MKLIIQIPCFNEAQQLPQTLADLPRQVDGFDAVEWLIVDDGSTDDTVEVARAHGVDHLVRLTNHRGLATGFQAGIDTALKLGADVIVNTDADNQYYGPDVARLVRPILDGSADMVIGDREVTGIEHFSRLKKALQRLGSWVVRRASSTSVPDTTSGFRAYNREAALQILVVSTFTYTLETIIQAGKLLVAIDHVPVRTNRTSRESRLFPSMGAYVRRNAVSIFRIYAQYEPLRVFWTLALLIGLGSLGVWARFTVAYAEGNGKGHVQSLILGAVLFIAAVVLWALGVIGDLLAAQRVMTHKTFERVRRLELELGVAPSHYEARDGAAPAIARDGARPREERFRRRGQALQPAEVGGDGRSEDGVAAAHDQETVRL
jgi:glycosyltransferase involved in cell wall biosynthesis